MTNKSDIKNAVQNGRIHQFIFAAQKIQSEGGMFAFTPEDIQKMTIGLFETTSETTCADLMKLKGLALKDGRPAVRQSFYYGLQEGLKSFGPLKRSFRKSYWPDFFAGISKVMNDDTLMKSVVCRVAFQEGLKRLAYSDHKADDDLQMATEVLLAVRRSPESVGAIDPDVARHILKWNVKHYSGDLMKVAPIFKDIREVDSLGKIVADIENSSGEHVVTLRSVEEVKGYSAHTRSDTIVLHFDRASGHIKAGLWDRDYRGATVKPIDIRSDSQHADCFYVGLGDYAENPPVDQEWVAPVAKRHFQRVFG